MTRTYQIFSEARYQDFDNFHGHYSRVAELVEDLTNSPEFARGLLETLAHCASETEARQDEILSKLGRALYCEHNAQEED